MSMGTSGDGIEDDSIHRGTKLRFDGVSTGHAGASSSSLASALRGSFKAFPTAGGFLMGVAASTGAHFGAAATEEEGGGVTAVLRTLVLFPVRWVGGAVRLGGGAGGVGDADAVQRFLDAVSLGEYARDFRATGFLYEEDFFGVTEQELAEEVKVQFAAQRRRILAHAARRHELADRGSMVWYLLAAGITVWAAAGFAFAIVLCASPRLRSLVGAYTGVVVAVAWYWGKKFMEYLKERRAVVAAEGDGACGGLVGSSVAARGRQMHGWMERGRGIKEEGSFTFGTDDDDSAFEGTPTGGQVEENRSSADPAAAAALLRLAERWKTEPKYVKVRDEFAKWRKSREEFADFDAELAKLKAAVPESELDMRMAICGDVDNMYARFLSSQQCESSVVIPMLRKTLNWRRVANPMGSMRDWRHIPKRTKDIVYDHYQSGWYTTHTPIGCPVYVERTGRLHVQDVLKTVSADDMVNHHTRMMEYLQTVILPEMAQRPGNVVKDKCINILDMHGLGLHMFNNATMSVLKRVISIDQANYPEIMYRCYIVNCPVVFQMFWRAIKPFIEKRIQQKIRIMGKVHGKNLEELSNIFGGVDRVPSFLGGGCKRTLKECPPWSLEHMDDEKFRPWEPSVPFPGPRSPRSSVQRVGLTGEPCTPERS